ncbi:MAG: ABC transporter permease [Victivallaceae bacterium]|nr:ABC transporter permease [Victivallaceae bacterium]
MLQKIRNIFELGKKEIWSILRDPMMVILIIYSFTAQVCITASTDKGTVRDAAVAVVDEDQSPLSHRMIDAILPPYFTRPEYIDPAILDDKMDHGRYTFAIVIPSNFQRDLLAGSKPEIQINVDATRMSQAFLGNGYIEQIIRNEADTFLQEASKKGAPQVEVVIRNKYNQNLVASWFSAINDIISNVTMLAIIMTGAAIIRERERSTLEHLLVMPVTSFEIMVSKIWSMALIVAIATLFSLIFVIRWFLGIPIGGSFALLTLGILCHLFAVTNMGILLACFAKSMPQLGLLMILVLMPMQMLSGGDTPFENMPVAVQYIMQVAPTTHFVAFSQLIMFKGAGFSIVWVPLAKMVAIGAAMFFVSLARFRKSVAS